VSNKQQQPPLKPQKKSKNKLVPLQLQQHSHRYPAPPLLHDGGAVIRACLLHNIASALYISCRFFWGFGGNYY